MQAALIILVGTIALTGCASMKDPHSEHFGFPSSYAEKPERGATGNNQKPEGNDSYVRTLPLEAQKALSKAGVEDIAFIAAIDKDGIIYLLAPENVKHDKVTFDHNAPLLNNGLTGLRPISIASYKSSHCFIWSDGTMVDINNKIIRKSTGGGYVSGGTIYPRFCLAHHRQH